MLLPRYPHGFCDALDPHFGDRLTPGRLEVAARTIALAPKLSCQDMANLGPSAGCYRCPNSGHACVRVCSVASLHGQDAAGIVVRFGNWLHAEGTAVVFSSLWLEHLGTEVGPLPSCWLKAQASWPLLGPWGSFLLNRASWIRGSLPGTSLQLTRPVRFVRCSDSNGI